MAAPVTVEGPVVAGGSTGLPARMAVLIGLGAAAVALGVGELVAGLVRRWTSPVLAVGDLIVDVAPRPVREFGIEQFGTGDKRALVLGIVVVAALAGAALGLASRREPSPGTAGLAAFGALGAVATLRGPAPSPFDVVPCLAATVAGVVALRLLRAAALAEVATLGVRPARPDDRRTFLVATAGAVAVAAGSGSLGRWLQGRAHAGASRAAVELPAPVAPVTEAVPGTEVGVVGVGPFLTPNRDFYRIDTALVVPQVPTEGWTLKVHGRVARPLELTFDQLLARPLVEEEITLACVSNGVGGSLVGNARWLGALLGPLLAEAGPLPGADQVIGRSHDGFTAGFPLAMALDGRPAMVAVGMNGEPLPLAHGFPARLVVPGLYGYVSATKWLTEVEVTTFADDEAYWIRRGWAVEGPIKLMSRIDTPDGSRRLPAGPVAVAGVAWAPTVGISAVEVRVDEGDWQPAELAVARSDLTWRQWVFRWRAPPGHHSLEVRATDGDGHVQTGERATPFPDGASGWHRQTVRIEG